MGKKTTKAKRRMKKSVRRTLGGLSLATAILIAAVPTPDSQAYDPATATIPDYAVSTTDYKYHYSDMEYDSNTDFKTMGTGSISKALVMSQTSIGSWQMDWQYEYWNQSSGSNGYITSYNSQYSVEDISLESRVYSDYVYITQEDVEKFYNATTEFVDVTIHYGDDTAKDKTISDVRALKYEYIINDKYTETRPADKWIAKNFKEDLAEYRTAYEHYENGDINPDTGIPYVKPDALVRTVADLKPTDTERVQFLCESVFGDGTPSMELVNVDKRKYAGASASWEKVYVPNIGNRPGTGTITIGGHSYYVDMSAFLCDTFATIVGVGKGAFQNVNNVKTLEMAKEISFIGDSAFEDSFVSSVNLSADAKIGNRAFYNCTKLNYVELPEGVRRVGAEAFYGCPIVNLTIPDSCTYVGPGAFANSGALKVLNFTSSGSTSSKTIGNFAFYNDLSLGSVDFGQSHITSIGTAAFAVNKLETGNLTDFTFPSYIGMNGSKCDIGEYCLAGRENLDYVTIPDNLNGALDDTIFYGCAGLECVTFGEKCFDMTFNSSTDGDKNVKNTMFYTVTNKNFYVRGPKLNNSGLPSSPRQSTWKAMFDYAATGEVGRHVPYVYNEGGVDYYEVSDGNYLLVIDKETGELVSCAFASVPSDIDNFTIPAVVGTTTVTGLKKGCFEGDAVNVGVLDYIINLTIEDGSRIASIDDNTFLGADKLKTVDIGNSINDVGAEAFADCLQLTKVTLGEGVSSIGNEAFRNCPNLENIIFDTPASTSTFPEGSIGTDAFNTKGTKLTITGVIAKGYAPFEWATDNDNYANRSNSTRALYKSPLPVGQSSTGTGLSVILDNQNGLATLVDYPHYEYLDRVAYDQVNDKLVALEHAPSSSYDPYYGETILDKINNGIALNVLEETMRNNCLNIVIPEGIESIDTQGFFNNSSKNPNGISSYSNDKSASAYFDTTQYPYKSYAKSGLFSGDFGDGSSLDSSGNYKEFDSSDLANEKVAKGNDRIVSVIANDLVYFPDRAFESCENLETIALGDDIKDVGALPFYGCNKLSSIACGNSNYSCVNGILYENKANGNKKIVECLSSRGKSTGGNIISAQSDPDLLGVDEIDPEAFSGCDGIYSVDFKGREDDGSDCVSKLTEIPEGCFRDCTNLSNVILPENVDDIGDYAFAYTSNGLKVTSYNRDVTLGNNTKEGVTLAYFINYEDARSRKTAQKQGYDIGTTLPQVWRVDYYYPDAIYPFYTETVENGKNADGPDEDMIIVPPGMVFTGWSGSLKKITEDSIRIAQFAYAVSPGVTPDVSPGVTPGTTPGVTPGTTPGVTPGTTPGVTPGTTPGVSPGVTGSVSPSVSPTPAAGGAKHRLTVVYGSGTGDYAAGTTVIIEAIDAPKGMVFDKWEIVSSSTTGAATNGTSSSGSNNQTASIYSATSKATTIKMGSSDVIVTATYKDDKSSSKTSTGTSTRTGGGTNNNGNGNSNSGTSVQITKPGISNVDKAYANVSGSTDNFIVRITESEDAANKVATALANAYPDMTGIKYFAMDISLYDATGTNRITDTTGLSVNVTMPIPDALATYAGNNRVGAVKDGALEVLPCKFVTVDGIPCVSFTATHFSPYTIYVDTENLTYNTVDVTPKTGDGIHPKWFAVIALTALSLILFLKKDKVVINTAV